MVATLTPELESFIESAVVAGQFASREEVIAKAVSEFRERQKELEWLRGEIARSDDDITAGRVRRFETIDELRAFGEEINARGMARLERKAAQP